MMKLLKNNNIMNAMIMLGIAIPKNMNLEKSNMLSEPKNDMFVRNSNRINKIKEEINPHFK